MTSRAVSVAAIIIAALMVFAPLAQADSVARPPDAEESFVGSFDLGSDIAFVYWDTTGSDRDLHVLVVAKGSAFFHTITVSLTLGGPSTGALTGASFFFDHKGFSGGFFVFDIYACGLPETSNGVCTPGEYFFVRTVFL